MNTRQIEKAVEFYDDTFGYSNEQLTQDIPVSELEEIELDNLEEKSEELDLSAGQYDCIESALENW